MKKQFLVIGNYGAGNQGDDLLCLATINGLREYFIGSDFNILVADSKELDYELMKLKEEQVAMLWPTGPGSLFRNLFNGEIKRTWQFFKSSDVVLFGGGGLLNCEVPKSLWVWGWQIFIAKLAKSKIVMLGQSFPEVNLVTHRGVFRWLMKQVDFIAVRDNVSYRVIKQISSGDQIIRLGADLVLTLDPNKYIYEDEKESVILVNFRYYKNIDPHLLEKLAYQTIIFLLDNTDKDIEFVCLDHKDRVFAEKLLNALPLNDRFSIKSFDDMREIFSCFARAIGCISMRLHGLILGFVNQQAIFSLTYNDKNSGWMDLLGWDDAEIDLRKELSIDEPEFVSRMHCFLRKMELETKNIEQIKKLRTMAQLNFDYLKGFLE